MTKSVLIIYTGGTIGMVNDPATGALCPFDFEQIAKAVPEIREFGFSINSYTLPEIIDSSDLKPALWADLCQIILDKYDQYSGFVILIAALEIAAATIEGKAVVPEVCILFGAKLFRGNRTTKINAESFDAFQSFNYPPLAEIGIHIHYNYGAINYTPRTEPICAFTEMNTNIAILQLFPGIRPELIDAVIQTPGLRGLILETYGSGNAPTDRCFLEKIKEASQKGIIIYNVTQCQGGTVEMGRYETSRELLNYGVSSGYDITMEAAVCKMMYLLEKYHDANEIKKYLNSSIKGEITMNHIGF